MTTDLRTQAIERLEKRPDFRVLQLVYTLVSALLWTDLGVDRSLVPLTADRHGRLERRACDERLGRRGP